MPSQDNSRDPLARKGRMVAVVIAATMVIWLIMQEIGRQYGWSGRFALLFDFAAIAALFWTLIVSYQLWQARARARQTDKD